MPASFPTSVKTFTTKLNGDTIQPAHVNDAQDEITAIEQTFLNGGTLPGGTAKVTNLDADKVDGLDALQWTTYSPTIANFTQGNGTVSARYARLGTLVFFRVDIVLGGTSAVTGTITVSLPVTAAAATGVAAIGYGEAIDSGTNAFPLTLRQTSTTEGTPVTYASGTVANINGTNPHAWASTDELHLAGCFVAA